MKILMIARSNLYQFGGGDRVQLLKTKAALEARGHEVTVATGYVANARHYDVVHLFNMMLAPHAFVIHTLSAHRQGKPVALSTIYWNPSEWLEATEKQGVPTHPAAETGPRTGFFDGVPTRTVIWFLLTSRTMQTWLWLSLVRRGSGQASRFIRRFLLAHVDIILPNGEKEREQVERDFGQARRSRFIPNGTDDDFKDAKAEDFEKQYGKTDFVLHVGRIETRKNLLAAVRAVRELKLPLVLIGNTTYDPAYVQAVMQAAPAETLVVPELPYEQLGAAYKAARVHVIGSWFETPGLSSLEAGLAGCNVVSTDRGTTTEYFADLAWYCDPANPESIKQAIKAAWEAPKSDQLRRHLLSHYTWAHVAEATEAAYTEIVRAA